MRYPTYLPLSLRPYSTSSTVAAQFSSSFPTSMLQPRFGTKPGHVEISNHTHSHVAQYLRPNSWLLSTTMSRLRLNLKFMVCVLRSLFVSSPFVLFFFFFNQRPNVWPHFTFPNYNDKTLKSKAENPTSLSCKWNYKNSSSALFFSLIFFFIWSQKDDKTKRRKDGSSGYPAWWCSGATTLSSPATPPSSITNPSSL